MPKSLPQVQQLLKFSQQVLNDFYQGLKLLIEFETGQCSGAMSSQFYAINKVVAHIDMAMEQGNLIAPYFMHYLADKYEGLIEKKLLPKLSAVPSHKSQAESWLLSYSKFLKAHDEINRFSTDKIMVVNNEKQIKRQQKSFEKKARLMLEKISSLAQADALGGQLAAKLYQHLKKQTHIDTNEFTIAAYDKAAFFPDVLGKYEYYNYLLETKQFNPGNERHLMLLRDIQILNDSMGQILPLYFYYRDNNNSRLQSQWIFQAAIHGDVQSATYLLVLYIEDKTQWLDPISSDNQLSEAIKLYHWIQTDKQVLWKKISELALIYKTYIGDNKRKASFLSYVLININDALTDELNQLTQTELVEKYGFLMPAMSHIQEITLLAWELNNQKLPDCLKDQYMAWNELGLKYQSLNKQHEAEQFFRKAYELNSDDRVAQYNLANNLETLKKNSEEQVYLYRCAASQGCMDSFTSLFRVCVAGGQGSVEELIRIKHLLLSVKDESLLANPKQLLLFYLNITIHERKNDIKLVTWKTVTIDNKPVCVANFNIVDHSQDDTISSDADLSDSPSDDDEMQSAQDSIVVSSLVSTTKDKQEEIKPLASSIEKKDKSSASIVPGRFNFFEKPQIKERKQEVKAKSTSKQSRALNTLASLNKKGIRQLTTKDFIKAKKAYNVLVGIGGGLNISHKGRTSGSRVTIGGKNIHLTHGRDRPSIGAQREIKNEIDEMCSGLGVGQS